MLTVTRHGITSRFETRPWPDDALPSLYRPFLSNQFYEQAFLDHVRRLNRRGVYVDAGSCLGTHTVWFASYCPSTFVHAFDPRERCAAWTQMNVEANGLQEKVAVHAVGLSNQRGRASARLDRVTEHFDVVPLDDVVRRARVAVLKIDVEGMEDRVLQGAGRILRRDRPVVFAEAWDDEHLAVVTATLAPYGYVATGRVFNSTPTYEFVVPAAPPGRLRRAARRLPAPVRKVLVAVRDVARGLLVR